MPIDRGIWISSIVGMVRSRGGRGLAALGRAADVAARRERWIYWAIAVVKLPWSTCMGLIMVSTAAVWAVQPGGHCVAFLT